MRSLRLASGLGNASCGIPARAGPRGCALVVVDTETSAEFQRHAAGNWRVAGMPRAATGDSFEAGANDPGSRETTFSSTHRREAQREASAGEALADSRWG